MRWSVVLVFAVLATGARAADVPQSVWKTEADTARHLQSSWDCPASFDGFTRGTLKTYDAYGLDVQCDYGGKGGDKISLYLSKQPNGADLDQALEIGKSAIVKVEPSATLLPDAEQKSFDGGGMTLAHALYGLGQTRHSGVWFGRAGEWLFEIRATYAAERQDATFATLAKMTAHLSGGALAHLERCAKSPEPKRDGVAVALTGTPANAMTMAYVMAAALASDPDAKPEDRPDPKTVPVEWCAEGGLSVGGAPVLIWRGLNAEGAAVTADRASLMTMGEPIAVETDLNAALNQIESELKFDGLPVYAVTTMDGGRKLVVKFFTRRPPEADLAQIAKDVADGKARYLGGFDAKTRTLILSP